MCIDGIELHARQTSLLNKDATQTMTTTEATRATEGSKQAVGKNVIRPFRVSFPEAELTDLRRRIKATKWPERETVNDASQGVQLATTQALAHYWVNDYDFSRA